MSRCVRDGIGAGGRGVVVAVQRRGCHVTVDGRLWVVLSQPGGPLAPNAIAVDGAAHRAPRDERFRVGQVVTLGGSASSDGGADWLVPFDAAALWEPRPPVHPIGRPDLCHRIRTTWATVVGEGVGESLLPLLWQRDQAGPGWGGALNRTAGAATRLLREAATCGDTASVTRAARRLAGLGPGLTPSGDDLLAGFVAAWTLLGAALGLGAAARERVPAAVLAGAESRASALGRAWLRHASRGELLEPMTRLVAAMLAPEPGDLEAATRGALAVGASSGTDWMVGFLLAVPALLDGPTAARPW
jgi:hypothetical protein